MIQLKSLRLKTPFFQSPMAGCTNIAFRFIARKLGLELAFTEMISAEALVRGNKKTLTLLQKIRGENLLGTQLVGHNPASMGKAGAMLEALGVDILDLNLGCPVRKITGVGAGSALLRKPYLAEKIFKSVMKYVKHIPVTVKMRTGFEDPSGLEAIRIAQIAEDCGLSAVTVHGRTRTQGYTGKADWKIIAFVKKAVRIPVFGNGDIFRPEDAKRMMEFTGCDGVAIGRGALGNPWLYRQIHAVLNGKKYSLPSLQEKKKIALQHLRLEAKYEGKKNGLFQSRKIVSWYFKGLPNAAQLRGQVNCASTMTEMTRLIKNFNVHKQN